MSLFKVRDFWTFELNKLADQFISDKQQDASEMRTHNQDVTREANFVVSVGRFHSIGNHDVFVCGNLNGFICLIQVPQSECRKYPLSKVQATNTNNSNTNDKSPISSESGSANVAETINHKNPNSGSDIRERQLLVAQNLTFPIVDLKCGFFTSAIKRSIAVLTFGELIVYQVKYNQLDLLSIDENAQNDLLSHKLEEHHRFNLLSNEIGANLVVLDRHSENKLSNKLSNKQTGQRPFSKHHIRKSLDHQASVQQLHLPQRDTIVVQYTNQFILTIVDHKKIVGHFSIYESCLETSGEKLEESSKYNEPKEVNKNEQLSKFVGFQPMTFHKSTKTSDLAIALSLSDYSIHSIPLSRLLSKAKQNVMSRVAQNLLHDKSRRENTDPSISQIKSISSSINTHDGGQFLIDQSEITIDLNLNSIEQWQFQLAHEPIQMQSIQRIAINTYDSSCQILVMSRYNLDLISDSGQHLWSQRFETALICIYSYTMAKKQARGEESIGEERAKEEMDKSGSVGEKLLTFVCTDCLSSEKSNLIILEEDKIVWSALLNAIPLQIWRSKLTSKVFSTIATLDAINSQLNVSYLGTNLDSGCEDQEEDRVSSHQLVADLNNHFDDRDCYSEVSEEVDDKQGAGFEKCKLRVDARLEASDHWPNVKVESKISIKPRIGNTFGLLQNIVAILEFDNLLEYQPISHQNEFFKLNEGAIQLQLGNCWPDRQEPLVIAGTFSLKISSKFDPCRNEMDDKFQQIVSDKNLSGILPKSLKVNIYLRFNEAHSSCSFQEETFLLPFSMVAKLVHIDYSSGQNQSLEDVQENLNYYNREQYYFCDLSVRSQIDMIEVIGEIIESDLICRGLNSESPDLLIKGNHRRKFSTLESINLLAQSLDCRLKFKSELHPSSEIDNLSESNQEYTASPVVMISIALEFFNGGCLMNNSKEYSVVWLHLTDFGETGSNLPEELIQQHVKEWKVFKTVSLENEATNNYNSKIGRPILISIESDCAKPILFLQNHLIQRLKVRAIRSPNSFQLVPMLETTCNAIRVNYSSPLNEGDFIAISIKLHNYLRSFLQNYENNFRTRLEQVKGELPKVFYKFNLSSFTSLSLSKRLSGFPGTMLKQFNILSSLTKLHHQDLLKLLTELEKLSKLDYHYSKVPQALDIFIETSEDQLITWPDFVQLID